MVSPVSSLPLLLLLFAPAAVATLTGTDSGEACATAPTVLGEHEHEHLASHPLSSSLDALLPTSLRAHTSYATHWRGALRSEGVTRDWLHTAPDTAFWRVVERMPTLLRDALVDVRSRGRRARVDALVTRSRCLRRALLVDAHTCDRGDAGDHCRQAFALACGVDVDDDADDDADDDVDVDDDADDDDDARSDAISTPATPSTSSTVSLRERERVAERIKRQQQHTASAAAVAAAMATTSSTPDASADDDDATDDAAAMHATLWRGLPLGIDACFVYVSSCPKHVDYEARAVRDVWGEQQRDVHRNRTACFERALAYLHWCNPSAALATSAQAIGDDDRRVRAYAVFARDGALVSVRRADGGSVARAGGARVGGVAADTAALAMQRHAPPSSLLAGCVVRASSCPAHRECCEQRWFRDRLGEQRHGAAVDADACAARGAAIAEWCASSAGDTVATRFLHTGAEHVHEVATSERTRSSE